MPGLVTVDGVTVPLPLVDGLAARFTDIPTIFQTQAQEPALGPAENDENMTTAQFRARLSTAFSQWPAVSPDALLSMYHDEMTSGGPQRVYETIVADMRVVCGNIAVAKVAADSKPRRTSKQYYTVVVAKPSHPLYIFDDTNGIRNSAHFVDLESLLGLVGGSGGCCVNTSWSACNPQPRCNRQTPGPHGHVYVERDADRAQTATLRRAVVEFAATGEVKGWLTADVGGMLLNNTEVAVVPHLREERCLYWRERGFGPEFWWAN
jgi:hypothetical protein